MKFKKAIALALSSLMVFSVFAGCSNSGDSGSSGEKTNISFTSWGDANTTDDVMIQEVAIAVDRFNEENDKNIEITLEVYTSDTYMTKINAMAASNTMPDAMMQQPGQKCRDYANAGKLQALNEYLDADQEWKDSFINGAFDQVTFDDEIYAIPISYAASCVFYNTELFENAGVNASDIKTWDDFLAACQSLKDSGVIPLTMATSSSAAWCIALFTAYLAQRMGGLEPMEAIAARKEGYTFDQDCFIKAGEMTKDLLDKGYIQSSSLGDSADQATAYFTSGRAAMLCQGSWVIGQLNAEGSEIIGKVGVFTFPQVEGGKGDDHMWMVKTDNVSMSSDSENKEAVLEWMRYLTADEFQSVSVAQKAGKIPITDVEVDLSATPAEVQSVSKELESSTGGFMFFDEWFGNALGTEWNNTLNAIMAGTKTSEQAFKDLQTYATTQMDAGSESEAE